MAKPLASGYKKYFGLAPVLSSCDNLIGDVVFWSVLCYRLFRTNDLTLQSVETCLNRVRFQVWIEKLRTGYAQ